MPPILRGAGAWADFDNDGHLDFLLTGSAGTYLADIQPTNALYHNNGDATVAKVDANLPAVFDSSIAWGDFNNDGRPDLLIAGNTGSALITRVYRNDESFGIFTDIGAGVIGVGSGSVAWGDFDNDGWPDILLAGSTNAFASGAVCLLYRNNQDGTFTRTTANLPGVFEGSGFLGRLRQ